MDLYVLDGLNGIQNIINSYQSIIWNVQYFDKNDFQVIVPATKENLEAIQVGSYLVRGDDISGATFKNVMVVENYQLDFDAENGWLLTVTGKGLKNIVGQRIVWQQTNLSGFAETAIRQVITENIISPTDPKRVIDDFVLSEPKGFTEEIEIQLFGENIADWLVEVCKTYSFGWDVYIDNGKYIFELYKGIDRTYNQTDVPPVVFSPEFDNLLSSSYSYNKESYQNAALVGGEGEGTDQRTATVGTAEGLERFEAFIDGGSVSSNGEIITVETYTRMLEEYGQTQLDQTAFTQNFSGEIEPDGMYQINKDYFLGDLVQIENESGIKATPRIIEIIYADDENGTSVVPTFSEWEVN